MATALTRPKARQPEARITVHTHVLPVTPAQARETVAATDYPWQRPLRPAKVAKQKRLLAENALRIGTTISFATSRESQKRYMIDGRHTMTALGQSSHPYLLQYQEFEVETDADVAYLYGTFDQHQKRSLGDLYRVTPVFRTNGLTTRDTSQLGGATTFLASGFRQEYRLRGESNLDLLSYMPLKMSFMESWIPEMRQFLRAIGTPRRAVRHLLMLSSVLSVALVTHRFAAPLAQQFWGRVARDSGLEQGEPAWALLAFLRDTPTRQMEPALYQRTVASAWNFYTSDRPVRDLKEKRRTSRQPIMLNGTPHDGEDHYGYLAPDGTVYKQPRRMATLEEGQAERSTGVKRGRTLLPQGLLGNPGA